MSGGIILKKLFLLFFIFLITVFSFAVRISVPVGPASLPVFYMQENSDMNVEVSIHKNRDVVISKLIKGDTDIALLPTNEAAKLYNKDIEIKLINIHTWGVFYLLTTNPDIISWESLSGKEVYVPEKGGPMDILFKFITDNYKVKNIQIKRGQPDQITQLMLNDMAETVFIREPFVSKILLNNLKSHIIGDAQKEWKKITSIELPQAALVVRKDFLNKNKLLVDEFNRQYSQAITWVNTNIDKSAELGMKYMNISAKVTKNSVNRLNLNFKNAQDAKPEIKKYLKILYDFSPEVIGGILPNNEFYY